MIATPDRTEEGLSAALFEETYSPGSVRFWLAHWIELQTLASQGGDRATVRRQTGKYGRGGEPEYEDVAMVAGWVSLDGVEWAGGPSRNADLADHLAREYSLICLWWDAPRAPQRLTQLERREFCICARKDLWSANLPGAGGIGEPGKRAARLIADLEIAADGLCPTWSSTRRVFDQQQRLSVLQTRRGALADPAAWQRVMGPDPGYGRALARMAADLGWARRDDDI